MCRDNVSQMAQDLYDYGRTYDNDVMYGCDELAEYLTAKGYRKYQDVAEEILEELSNFTYDADSVFSVFSRISELKNKYTETEN